jgi:NAD(P)H-dependent nitrite reductase small subunit
MNAENYVDVASVDDIPDDEGICVSVGDLKVALFKHDGEIYALNNVCPHQGAPLHEGFYDDGIVTCPLHAWDFDVESGKVSGSTERAVTYPVRVSDSVVAILVE